MHRSFFLSLLISAVCFVALVAPANAADITYVGNQDAVELDANTPTTGWRNTTKHARHLYFHGIDPQKAYSGTLSLRISPDLRLKAAAKAKEKGSSLNALIEKAITEAI